MKRNAIIYWITTIFVALIMGISGRMAFVHYGGLMKALAQLGYPSYFSNILGWGKLIGVAALLAPGMPRLKEWAYAGFTITVVSACYSHFSSGSGLLALEPLITLAALAISYLTRPSARRLPDSVVL
jgi:uncharacterized membrane protein YphA (DoxX/SURF4 family)